MIINHLCRCSPGRRSKRLGTTLLELLVALVLTAILAAVALPRLRATSDRMAARGAIQEASSLFSLARRSAITRRALVSVVIDTVSGAVTVRAGPAVIARQALRARFGVRVTASRDSMSYDPRGLGYGAANLTLAATRGQAAETLFVSRLGRTRH